MDLNREVSIEDMRAIARMRVPRFVFDYVDGGSEDEVTLRANRESFERLRFRPRTLADVSQRNLRTTILGTPSASQVTSRFPASASATCARGHCPRRNSRSAPSSTF